MKMRRMKLIVAIALMASMLGTLFTGCGNAQPAVDSTPSSEAEVSSAAESAASEGGSVYDTSTPVHFVVYWNYSWKELHRKFEETAIGQEITKRMNATMEIQTPGGNENEKLSLMIASNSLPDVIMMDRNEAYKKLIDLDKLVALDDYYNKYPGYRENSDPATVNFAKVNDHIYSLLNWNTTPDHPTGNGGWFINEKIYKDMGSPALNTLDDLFNYLSQVKSKGYQANGKDVVPMQFDCGNFQGGIYQLYYSFGGIGVVNEDMVYQPEGKNELTFFMNDPRWVDAMVYANKLWNAGLINQDFFVETAQQMNDKRDTGRLAVYTGPNAVNECRDGTNAWKALEPDAKYLFVEPPAGGGFDQTKIANATFKTLGWNSICITKNAKDPERIYQVMDWISTDEGQLITFHGPKGLLWDEIDENGYPIFKKVRSSLTQEEDWAGAFEEYSLPGMSKYVDFSKSAANEKLPEDQRDTVISNQANISWHHSANVTAYEGIFTAADTPEGIAFKQVQDYVRKQLPKMVMAKDAEETKAVIQETIDQVYKMDFKSVEAYKTKIWQDNLTKLK